MALVGEHIVDEPAISDTGIVETDQLALLLELFVVLKRVLNRDDGQVVTCLLVGCKALLLREKLELFACLEMELVWRR